MLNPSPTDQWIVDTLRYAEIPAPPPSLTTQLIHARPKRRLIPLLTASGIVSATAILVVAVALQPTASLAEVASAQAGQTEYTVVNTRILGDGRELKIVSSRDGDKWSVHSGSNDAAKDRWSQDVVMDGQRTVFVLSLPSSPAIAEVDGPTPLSRPGQFDIHTILRDGGKQTKSYGIKWHGRTVDRFEVHTTYPDRGRMQTLDQDVIADAHTHLPLQVQVFRDNRSWGDIWDYSYGKPAGELFQVNAPASTQWFDLKKQRSDLKNKLTKGAVLVDVRGLVQILLPAHGRPLDPGTEMTLTLGQKQIRASVGVRAPLPKLAIIDGNPWQAVPVNGLPTAKALDFKSLSQESASLTIGTQRLTGLPVFRVANGWSLLRPFLKK